MSLLLPKAAAEIVLTTGVASFLGAVPDKHDRIEMRRVVFPVGHANLDLEDRATARLVLLAGGVWEVGGMEGRRAPC